MKCIIYDKNTKKGEFNNYGYGKLKLINKCEVTEELNGRYDTELIIDRKDTKTKYIKKWSIISVDGQLFRIVDKFDNDKNDIKVFMKHIFYDINYGFIEDNRSEKNKMVEAMKVALPDEFKNVFEVSSDIESLNTLYFVKNYGADSMFEIIERWGIGEIVRDNFKIAINKSKGKDNGVTFTYKKIDEIEVSESTDQVITRLYPTGKDGLTLKEKYVTIPNWSKEEYLPFHITREVKFEGVDNEGTLRELAKQAAEQIGISRVNFKIKVNDLIKTDLYKYVPELLNVEVGDIVTIKHSELNIRAKVKVIKKVTEKTNGNVTIELGQPFDNLFDVIDNNKISIPTPDLSDYKEKMFYYSNGTEIAVTNVFKSVAFLNYGTTIRTNLTLYVNIFLNCLTSGKANIRLLIDNNKIDFSPSVNLEVGSRIISFTYPIISVEENIAHSIDIMMIMENGSISIPKDNVQVMLRGQGVSGGLDGERPHAEVIEEIPYMQIKDNGVTSSCITMTQAPIPVNTVQNINYTAMDITKVTTNVTVDIIHRGFVMLWEEKLYLNNENYNFGSSLTHKVEEFSNAGTLIVNQADHIVTECALPSKDVYYLIKEGELI